MECTFRPWYQVLGDRRDREKPALLIWESVAHLEADFKPCVANVQYVVGSIVRVRRIVLVLIIRLHPREEGQLRGRRAQLRQDGPVGALVAAGRAAEAAGGLAGTPVAAAGTPHPRQVETFCVLAIVQMLFFVFGDCGLFVWVLPVDCLS